MGRRFEKISFQQFQKDIADDMELYSNHVLPRRMTKHSAGYDFTSIVDVVLQPHEIKKIPTGIKAMMNPDEVLLLFVRSSMGFRYNVRMVNQVGVIDQDYYNNIDNEGHIFIKLQNEGDVPFEIKIGDRIAQGVFTKYLTVDDEEEIQQQRDGGVGFTTTKEG